MRLSCWLHIAGAMEGSRASHVSALLANGQVLVAGGVNDTGTALSSAVLFDPASGTFTDTADMTAVRSSAAAAVLKDGTVLVTGGFDAGGATWRAQRFISRPAGGTDDYDR